MPHREKTIWDKLNCASKTPPGPPGNLPVQLDMSSMQRSRRNQSMDGGIDAATDPKMPINREIQIAVLGAPGVGKTAIVSQFVHRSFPEKYKPTVENFYWIEYEVSCLLPLSRISYKSNQIKLDWIPDKRRHSDASHNRRQRL